MATEIVAFLLTISGWILVSSTLPTDYWKVSSVDGTVITTATFWSNLWKTCVTDSTGVSNCKDFPSMLALDGESCHDVVFFAASYPTDSGAELQILRLFLMILMSDDLWVKLYSHFSKWSFCLAFMSSQKQN